MHTLDRPVELGSSADSDNSSCIEHYIHHQKHNEGSSALLANRSDLMSFDDDSRSVESAVEALSGIEGSDDVLPGSSSSSTAGNRASVGSDFVLVTDSDVKEANKTPSPGFGSPQRRRKGLRKGINVCWIYIFAIHVQIFRIL